MAFRPLLPQTSEKIQGGGSRSHLAPVLISPRGEERPLPGPGLGSPGAGNESESQPVRKQCSGDKKSKEVPVGRRAGT